MTDKEIEKALEKSLTTGRCVGSYRNCKGCPLENMSVCNYRVSDLFARYKEQICKDTAKEILAELLVLVNNNENFGRGVLGWNTEEVKMLIKLYIKRKYGIEVDE